ncbi:YerC/YecD family TrpR-related protein [Kurthia senegalensis]|uniref:YerC/YecD family TrpR-related protein n=1 Tax=Kurthia senegalensis TaxID=1033740 RepID=UPI00028867AD|nr:YerC/YecD family TrpR-related protein [Kurthia senegalensis]
MQIEKIRGHQTEQLFKAVLELKDIDECYKFFDDLCTISEIQSLAQRFEVAHLLRLKKTYEAIKNETGASTATISRVRRCLDYGNDTYDEMLGRLYPDEKSYEEAKRK